MSKNILFTGFEAFADWSVNPTAVAATHLDGKIYDDVKIIGRVVPLRYRKIEPFLVDLVKKNRPVTIIMSGQAGGDKIRLERIAQNKAESKVPYNCGTVTTGQHLIEDGDESFYSTLPLDQYYELLRRHHIPVKYSDSAGLFGCNQIYYLARYLFPDIPAGFIHVPLLPEQNNEHFMSQDMIIRAFELICEYTANRIH